MRRSLLAAATSAILLALGCSSSGTGSGGTAAGTSAFAGASCPTDRVPVVVTVDQWADIVQQLGGACVEVSTIISGSAGDPHDYEPTPADNAKFTDAKLVVRNGVDYDHWSEQAVETLSKAPLVVDAGDAAGKREGDDPHVWYDPGAVDKVAAAITEQLTASAPAASTYFQQRADAWKRSMQPYRDAIGRVKTKATGKRYAATESVFDGMASAVGLQNVTPDGYQRAASNESDPSPGDVNAFQRLLQDKQVDVLIFNTQTEGAIPGQLRDAAERAGVPVIEVTETLPSGMSFERWQVAQLEALDEALG